MSDNNNIKTDGYPMKATRDTSEYRLMKKKDGSIVLQRLCLIDEYQYGNYRWTTPEWKDLKTVKEEK